MNEVFYEIVYEMIKLIPFGRVTTFGEIAKKAGLSKAARIVSLLVTHDQRFINTPCHRVVGGKGSLSKTFILGGRRAQKRMLEDEGIEVKKYKVDLQKYGFYFW